MLKNAKACKVGGGIAVNVGDVAKLEQILCRVLVAVIYGYKNGGAVNDIIGACGGFGLVAKQYPGLTLFFSNQFAVFYLNRIARDNACNDVFRLGKVTGVAVGFGCKGAAYVGLTYNQGCLFGINRFYHILYGFYVIGGNAVCGREKGFIGGRAVIGPRPNCHTSVGYCLNGMTGCLTAVALNINGGFYVLSILNKVFYLL